MIVKILKYTKLQQSKSTFIKLVVEKPNGPKNWGKGRWDN